MMYVVTGCFGFIGSKMCEFLLSKNNMVIGIDVSFQKKFDSKQFEFYSFGDLESIGLSDGKNIEAIYHFAWNGVSSSDKNDIDKQLCNIDITRRILKFAKDVNSKRIVIPGSISEFSKCNIAVTGNEKDSPSDMYSATKAAVRKIATQFCKMNNICLNWTLITSVYGPDRNDSNLLTYTINNLLKNEQVKTTKLEQKWDYIYIDDLINALYLVGNKGLPNVVYPIGSGRVECLAYYVKFIAKSIGKEHLLNVGAVDYKNNYIDNSIVDISELKKLGFECEDTFENNIIKVINSYKKKVSAHE